MTLPAFAINCRQALGISLAEREEPFASLIVAKGPFNKISAYFLGRSKRTLNVNDLPTLASTLSDPVRHFDVRSSTDPSLPIYYSARIFFTNGVKEFERRLIKIQQLASQNPPNGISEKKWALEVAKFYLSDWKSSHFGSSDLGRLDIVSARQQISLQMGTQQNPASHNPGRGHGQASHRASSMEQGIQNVPPWAFPSSDYFRNSSQVGTLFASIDPREIGNISAIHINHGYFEELVAKGIIETTVDDSTAELKISMRHDPEEIVGDIDGLQDYRKSPQIKLVEWSPSQRSREIYVECRVEIDAYGATVNFRKIKTALYKTTRTRRELAYGFEVDRAVEFLEIEPQEILAEHSIRIPLSDWQKDL